MTEKEKKYINKLINEKNDYIKKLKFDLDDTENFNAKLKYFILSEKTIDDYEEFLKSLGNSYIQIEHLI